MLVHICIGMKYYCRAGSEATNRGIVGQISKSMTSIYIYVCMYIYFLYSVTLRNAA